MENTDEAMAEAVDLANRLGNAVSALQSAGRSISVHVLDVTTFEAVGTAVIVIDDVSAEALAA